jgi:hypothetical protein
MIIQIFMIKRISTLSRVEKTGWKDPKRQKHSTSRSVPAYFNTKSVTSISPFYSFYEGLDLARDKRVCIFIGIFYEFPQPT